MFHVGDEKIEAFGRHDLGDRRMPRQRPPAQNRLAALEFLFGIAHGDAHLFAMFIGTRIRKTLLVSSQTKTSSRFSSSR